MRPAGKHPPSWSSIGLLLGSLVIGIALGWWLFRPNLAAGQNATAPLAAVGPITLLPTPASVGGDPRVGEPPPDFTLDTLDGGQVTLSALRGQPVLINFWASWCPPCRLEMPDLVRAYEAHKGKGFVILGVNLTFQDSLPDIRAFVKEFNMTFPVLLDEEGEVTENLYRLRGLPMSIFVNRSGVIARIHLGGMTGQQIDEFVGEILR